MGKGYQQHEDSLSSSSSSALQVNDVMQEEDNESPTEALFQAVDIVSRQTQTSTAPPAPSAMFQASGSNGGQLHRPATSNDAVGGLLALFSPPENKSANDEMPVATPDAMQVDSDDDYDSKETEDEDAMQYGGNDASSSSSSSSSVPCDFQGCEKRYASRENMRTHFREKHKINPRRVACSVEGCHDTFTRQATMRRHVKNVHADISNLPAIPCTFPDCDKIFGREDYMRAHARTHDSDWKGFPCDVAGCNYRSDHNNNLTKHKKRMHSTSS